MQQGLCLENMQIVPAQVAGPADVNGAAVTGDYVNLRDFEKVAVVVSSGDGAGEAANLTVSLYQAKDVAGTGAKALSALSTGRIYAKEADANLSAVGQWAKVAQDTPASSYTSSTSGAKVVLWVFEIRASDLDANNGFGCIRADIAATTGAKVVSALYLLCGAKLKNAPELMPSAIA